MDPNLLKKLGMIVFQAPAGDGGGGGDGGEEAEVEGEEAEEEEETEEEDPEEDPEEEETEEEETEEDPEGEEEDKALGERAQKRIGKLVKERNSANAEVKRLKGELEAAQKLSGDDGKAILAAAAKTGILPGLMTKDEAEAFEAMSQYPGVIDHYRDWLDEHDTEDTYGEGDHAMTYGQVRKRVRKLTEELDDLKDQYGERRKELKGKVKRIFELGMEAYRKGAGKPDEKKPKAKKVQKKPSVHPHGRKPIAKGGKKKNWGEVDGTDSFVKMIASQNNEE